MANAGLVKYFLTVRSPMLRVGLQTDAAGYMNRKVKTKKAEHVIKGRCYSTTTLVVVRSTPDTAWIFEIMVIPNALISGPSTKAMTSCGPVTA
jgi:hypothetical protein